MRRFRALSRLGRGAAVAAVAATMGTLVGPWVSPASAAVGGILVTEVAPWGSGNSPYGADWFELTNTGAAPIDLTGWKLDDNSNAAASAVTLTGVSTVAPSESVLFLETAAPLTTIPLFLSTWFGASPPAGLKVGSYSGSGVGLSTGGDAVNIYDAANALQAKVTFGASPAAAPFASFDNAAGLDNAAISTLSAVGVNGAFGIIPTPAQSAIGSPGAIANSGPLATTTTTTAPTTTTTTAPPTSPWPGGQTVANASTFAFGGNMSGLIEEGSGSVPGVLWGARNGPGALFRMLWDGTNWAPDTADNWGAGKLLRYPDGTGDVDAEGVTFASGGSAAGLFVAAERNNVNNTVSRLSILRFDPAAPGATLTATREWNLTADIPPTGANLGLEAITWVPDSYLVSTLFADMNNGQAYNPALYPNHGDGLFFVGVEGSGQIYAYALDLTSSSFTRVATFTSGHPVVMELQFDRETNQLWAVCDNTCSGRHNVLDLTPPVTLPGVRARYDRPTGMPNLNNEGFAIAPLSQCQGGFRPVTWADDGETGGVALRRGTLACPGPDPVVPEFPVVPLAVIGLPIAALMVMAINRRHLPLA